MFRFCPLIKLKKAGEAPMFTLETTSRYRCQCCDSPLQTAPEYECSEWFLRCVSCGAKNLFVLTLSFIGWRPAEGSPAPSAPPLANCAVINFDHCTTQF